MYKPYHHLPAQIFFVVGLAFLPVILDCGIYEQPDL